MKRYTKLGSSLSLLFTLGIRSVPALGLPVAICAGDCNHDRRTAVDELVTGVGIALGTIGLARCPVVDLSGDGEVNVGELVRAVGAALGGCAAPQFEASACEVPLPAGQDSARVECGFVTVPENRDRPSGRTVRLAVVVLRATAASPAADPLVLLDGGPGGGALDGRLPAFTADFAAPLQSKRDLVFFDQRGTGRSQPALNCPEVLTPRDSFAELLTAPEEAARDAAYLIACHDRLTKEGNDLTAYDSAAGALDIADIMAALGYERFNIYGLSYGTRVALTALRDLPAPQIRSAVLDSVVPLQASLFGAHPASTQRSLNLLFTSCAADAACNAAFPDVRQRLFALREQLNTSPLTLIPRDPDGQPFTVVVTGDRLIRLASTALQSAMLIPFLPLFAADTAGGNTTLLTVALSQLAAPQYYSPGLGLAVLCNEEIPFDTPEVLARAEEGVDPIFVQAFSAEPYRGDTLRNACAAWGPPPGPVENEPVQSEVPALILAGQYDTSTPPAYAQLAAATLPHSYIFEFRGFGHVELSPQAAPSRPPACAMQVMAQFLDDPTHAPDGSCVDALAPVHFVGS